MGKIRKKRVVMISRSRKRMTKPKRVLVNLLYKFGIRVNDIVNLTGLSRATVYRHIRK